MSESKREAHAPAAGPASLLRRSNLPAPSAASLSRALTRMPPACQHGIHRWFCRSSLRRCSACCVAAAGAQQMLLLSQGCPHTGAREGTGTSASQSHTHAGKRASRGAPDVCRHACSLLCTVCGRRGEGVGAYHHACCGCHVPCRHTQRVWWVYIPSVFVGCGNGLWL